MSMQAIIPAKRKIAMPVIIIIGLTLCVYLAISGADIAFLFAALAFTLIAGFPVSVALAGSSLAYIMVAGETPSILVLHRMVEGVNSFPLLAVPFFIFAGALMNTGGITMRIFDFAKSLVGWLNGGLAHVNVGASVIFAGMSGAAVADAGGLGMIEIKAMRQAGYDRGFSVGITAASSTIGPIIPPSLPLIIYGVMASASIGQLFIAGIVPGIMMALSLMAMIAWYARKKGYPRDEKFSISNIGYTFKRAFLSLMTPVLIIVGITSGVFTPTEAAIAAVVYALFLSGVVYRSLSFRQFVKISIETLETTAVIMLIAAAASVFGWIIASNQIPDQLANFLLGITDSKTMILIIITLILFVVGCFMEPIAAITILVPALLPIAIELGVDPIQFGIIMVLNLMIGLLTPPVGLVLYVLSQVSKVPFEECVRATAPFLVPLVAVLLLVTFVPAITLAVPNFFYG